MSRESSTLFSAFCTRCGDEHHIGLTTPFLDGIQFDFEAHALFGPVRKTFLFGQEGIDTR